MASIHKIGGGGTPYSIMLTKNEDIATGELLYDQGISAVKLITEGVYFKVPPGNYRVHYTCEVTQSEQMLSEGSVELTEPPRVSWRPVGLSQAAIATGVASCR